MRKSKAEIMADMAEARRKAGLIRKSYEVSHNIHALISRIARASCATAGVEVVKKWRPSARRPPWVRRKAYWATAVGHAEIKRVIEESENVK